jgi:hypothetical protein
MKKSLSSLAGMFTIMSALLISCEKNSDFGNSEPGIIKNNDLNLISYVSQPSCGGALHSDLFAGKDTKVGEVIVTLDGSLMKVKYIVKDGWAISATHLSVTNSLEDVPTGNGGNPKTGLFNYNSVHDPAVTAFGYDNIPVNEAGELYILAHAEVRPVLQWKTDIQAFNISLPETAVMKIDYPVGGSTSYLKTTITDGGILNGTYNSWCIDVDNVIYNSTHYLVKVISSYDPDFINQDLVENPQNMDMVNWIINQDFPGRMAPDSSVYTYGDVQRAVWELLDDNVTESGLGSWSQERVTGIISAAATMGSGYTPECGEQIAVILRPVDMAEPFQTTITQFVLTEFPAACQPVCGKSETAWAAGYDFGGSNWAKYFTFCVGN